MQVLARTQPWVVLPRRRVSGTVGQCTRKVGGFVFWEGVVGRDANVMWLLFFGEVAGWWRVGDTSN